MTVSTLARRGLLATGTALLGGAAGQPPTRPQARPPARPPGRIVSLDYGLAETLLALGTVPVGLPGPDDYRTWVVQPPLPPGVEDVGQRTQPNLELLAELAPDLILAVPDHAPILPLLQAVAPVLTLPIYTPARQPWRNSEAAARELARRLGRPDAAEALIGGVEARLADARAALAGHALAGHQMPPLLLGSFVDPRHLRVYGQGCILHAALGRLGLRNAWTGPTGPWGSATIGLEALARFPDAALFTIDPPPPDLVPVLAHSPLWQALPLVRAGRVFSLPPVLMFGTLPAADRFMRLLLPLLLARLTQAVPRD